MMLNGGGVTQQQPPQQRQHQSVSRSHDVRRTAYVEIVEQPASKALRFRYECEGRSAGSIPGASSTPENKTFPEIRVVGYKGASVVVVSCVTKTEPYLVHPHNLVGKDGCNNGVCTVKIPPDTMRVQFQNLGIQCVKKRDIEMSLRQREDIRVDPFRCGYHHRNQPTSIDLNAVRLCFQVFLEGDPGKFTIPLKPVVSDIIYDKKAMSELSIIKLSDSFSYVDGGRKDIILLCEKVAKEDIEVHFFEKATIDKGEWREKAEFQPTNVHKQHAIWFRTPRYHTLDVTEPVQVFIQLHRPSDGMRSDPLPFEFLPMNAVVDRELHYKRKKVKLDNKQVMDLLPDNRSMMHRFVMDTPLKEPKLEPTDRTSPFGGSNYAMGYPTSSPQYARSPEISPHQYSSPSPDNRNYQYRVEPANLNAIAFNIPSQPSRLMPQWNITPTGPSSSQQLQHQPMSWTTTPGGEAAPQLLDLDNNQISSGELQHHLNAISSGPLTDIESLTFDLDLNAQNQNVMMSSDSLTNIVNEAVVKNLGGE